MISQTLAWSVTLATLAVFAVAGIVYARGRVDTLEDYITARGTLGLGAATATIVASVMGGWILFSPGEAGAAFGGLSAVLGYATGSTLAVLAYAVVGPRIRALIPQGHTLTEYALVRYGPAFFGFVVFVTLFYMFFFLAANLSGIGSTLVLTAGIPAWASTALVGLFVLAYTAYGGLKASIFTDTLQTLVILPLLALTFAGALFALGGAGEVHGAVLAADASLLDPGFLPGVMFGVTVIVAIVGAEMLNQTWWQRIFATRDRATLRRAFLWAAVAIFPMVLLPGLFGVIAQGLGAVGEGQAPVALFALLTTALPDWIVLGVLVLALLLVMSTMDTLLNAIASIATADLPRLLPRLSVATLTGVARGLTVLAAAGAIAIAAQGYSVLAIFLTADLFCAATFVPLLAGLWTRRLGGTGALVSSLAGLAVGLVYFPFTRGIVGSLPGLASWLPEPAMLEAFVAAALVSGACTAVFTLAGRARFDHGRLAREIRALPGSEPAPAEAENRDGGSTRGPLAGGEA